MQAALHHYNSEDIELMGRVCDEAWNTFTSQRSVGTNAELALRYSMASKILRAVAAGERDPEVLRGIALG